eukprot:IDg8686t1
MFEDAIVKLQRQNPAELSIEQRNITSFLVHNVTREIDEEQDGLPFAHRALKRQKIIAQDSALQYTDSRFLVPTSNICERVFSKAGYALTDRRKCISHAYLEAMLFLHFNLDLWESVNVNS